MTEIRGKVVRIFSNTTVAVDVGLEAGVKSGMRFTIYTAPMAVTDLDGKSLGSVWFTKGRVRATGVYPKFSILETEVFVPPVLASGLKWPARERATLNVRDQDISPGEDIGVVVPGDMVVSEVEPAKEA
ncbi:MAG TPA: hypothetical protein VM537_17375 [Anaerolineae bacterium]|nr:hypothetical protein [Anaerolineae bacterium]